MQLSGILICIRSMYLGATTGYALNPARDFGRLAYTICLFLIGNGELAICMVQTIGPLIGAGLAVVFLN